jgi:hypothetical protein
MSGNQLLERCRAEQGSFARGICYGYINGIADVLSSGIVVNGWSACFPAQVTSGQVVDVVTRYLTANPQVRHMSAPGIAAAALEQAFPCP